MLQRLNWPTLSSCQDHATESCNHACSKFFIILLTSHSPTCSYIYTYHIRGNLIKFLQQTTRFHYYLYTLIIPSSIRPSQVDSQFIVPAHMDQSHFFITHYFSLNNHFSGSVYVWEVYLLQKSVCGTNRIPSLRITQNSQQTFSYFCKVSKNAK